MDRKNHRSDGFNAISPDGLPITSKVFSTREEAEQYIVKWCKRFQSQGHYLTAEWVRIPVNELAKNVSIVPARETFGEMWDCEFEEIQTKAIDNNIDEAGDNLNLQSNKSHEIGGDKVSAETVFVNRRDFLDRWSKMEIRERSDAGSPVEVAPKALEQMANWGENLAARWMEQVGFCPQGMIIWGIEGNYVMDRPPPFDQGETWFTDRARVACVAAGAYGVAFFSSASARHPDSSNRDEVVLIVGESRQGRIHRILPVLRDEKGIFRNFGASAQVNQHDFELVAEFLSVNAPGKEERAQAMAEVAKRGIELRDLNGERRERGRGMRM